VAPEGGYTCQQQKEWGKCAESWMKGFCDQTVSWKNIAQKELDASDTAK
jgi:hypothetical protein